MVGNKIIAAIRSDGKVYPLDDGNGRSVTGGSVLNSNHTHFANLVNMKLRVGSGNGQQNMNDNAEIIMTNNRIQASVMDLGKKLLQCARDNDVNGVESMMKKGAPFASDWLGMTALHFAAMNDRYDICKLLLISGGNKDARTKVDRTPLHLAAFYGHERIAQLLIEYQCSLNPRDMLRMTPLHWAVEKRHKGIVRLLLKHQADVTAISKFGKTPIALAVLTEQADILQELENARQIQQNKKYNEQHEKETNEAVNSIMGTIKDEDEPQSKRAKISVETENPTKNNFDIPIDNLEDINVPDEKNFDNSTINLLKSHGISMMKDDEDTPDNLLTTVLQNGRQLILSEGGKLLLNEAKRLGGNKVIETMKSSPSSHSSSTMTQVRTRTDSEASQTQSIPKFRPNIISKPKEVTRVVAASDITANNNSDKQFKNIRIISLNDFKKLYGTGNVKPLQKFDSSLNKTQVIKFKSEEKKVFPQRKIVEEGFKMETISHHEDSEYHDDDDEENDLPPNIVKVSAESDQEDSSDIESPHSNQTSVIHPPVQQPVIEPRLLPGRKLSTSNNSRVPYSRAPSVASSIDFKQERTPVIPLLTIPEICRQLLELRKQNDELRRKYEIAQKEKEDFRNRLERLEALLLLEQAEEGYSEM